MLQNLYSKISDQLRRLQVEEMILKKHQEVFELNGGNNIQELNNFISSFMTQYVTVKPEPVNEEPTTTIEDSTPGYPVQLSTTAHQSFGSMLLQNMANYTGSMSQLLLGHDITEAGSAHPNSSTNGTQHQAALAAAQDEAMGVPTSHVPDMVQDSLVPGDLPAIAASSEQLASNNSRTEEEDDEDFNVEDTDPSVLEKIRRHEQKNTQEEEED